MRRIDRIVRRARTITANDGHEMRFRHGSGITARDPRIGIIPDRWAEGTCIHCGARVSCSSEQDPCIIRIPRPGEARYGPCTR
jgi:hypothetical protein